MQTITINRNLVSKDAEEILVTHGEEISGATENYRKYKIYCEKPHGLIDNEVVKLSLDVDVEYPIEYTSSATVINPYIFVVEVPIYSTVQVENLGWFDYDNGNSVGDWITVSGNKLTNNEGENVYQKYLVSCPQLHGFTNGEMFSLKIMDSHNTIINYQTKVSVLNGFTFGFELPISSIIEIDGREFKYVHSKYSTKQVRYVGKLNDGNIESKQREYIINYNDEAHGFNDGDEIVVKIKNIIEEGESFTNEEDIIHAEIKKINDNTLSFKLNTFLLIETPKIGLIKCFESDSWGDIVEYKPYIKNDNSIESPVIGQTVLHFTNKGDYIHKYVKNSSPNGGGVTLRYDEKLYTGYRGITYDIDGAPTNEEDDSAQEIITTIPMEFVGFNSVDIFNDWYYDETIEPEGELGKINRDIRFFKEGVAHLNLSVCMGGQTSYRLVDEQSKINNYFNEVKQGLLPEIIDYEKRQFIPVVRKTTTPNLRISLNSYTKVNEIEFNLHFRDRMDENGNVREDWSTTDEQYWNNLSPLDGSNTNLVYDLPYMDDSYADTLNLLGFTEDDVKYSRNALKKSFLRLSFYPNNDINPQEMLYTSTIYFDMGEMRQTYSFIKNKNLLVFDDNNDKKLRLSAKFSVKDKYSTTNSSEGFYLYLFPDEIGVKTSGQTIYMKVEFNNAKYGKDGKVVMMLPRDEDGKIIKATDTGFPQDMMDNDGGTDINYFNDMIKIPINIRFDNNFQKYVYEFPFITNDENKIILNLFEPKNAGQK